MNLPKYIKQALYETEDKETIALIDKAYVLLNTGMHPKTTRNAAIKSILKAEEIFSRTDKELLTAFCHYFLGELYFYDYQLETSKKYFKSAYDIFFEKGNLMYIGAGQKVTEIEREIKGEKPDLSLLKIINPSKYDKLEKKV